MTYDLVYLHPNFIQRHFSCMHQDKIVRKCRISVGRDVLKVIPMVMLEEIVALGQ